MLQSGETPTKVTDTLARGHQPHLRRTLRVAELASTLTLGQKPSDTSITGATEEIANGDELAATFLGYLQRTNPHLHQQLAQTTHTDQPQSQ